VFEWDRLEEPGETVTFCLVDVAYEVMDRDPEADYRVISSPGDGGPGRLEFVGGRGLWASPVPADRPAVA